MDLLKQIVFKARMIEDDPAIAFAGGVATYGMLMRTVEAAGACLDALDLSTGDIVVVENTNPVHHVALLLALALRGMPSASMQNTKSVLDSGVRPALFITDGALSPVDGIKSVRVDERWFAFDPTRLIDYDALFALPGFASKADVVRLAFSSGTTGYPKAVALTGASIEARTFSALVMHGGAFHSAMRALVMFGFSTIAAFSGMYLLLLKGGLACYASRVPDALNLMRVFRVEVLAAPVVLLDHFTVALKGKSPIASLALVVAVGSRISPQLMQSVRATLCPNVFVAYGSSETGMLTQGTAEAFDRYDASVGYVLPGISLQAVDADDNPVPPGEDGILRVKSPEQATYLVPSRDTDEMTRDGWFYPGDVGRIHADGLVAITGRTKEVINHGGAIVAPDYVEAVLLTIPGILEAAVFGRPNRSGIEEIWAATVTDRLLDERMIIEIARKSLADKAPARVIMVETLPRTETGKVKRVELAQRFAVEP